MLLFCGGVGGSREAVEGLMTSPNFLGEFAVACVDIQIINLRRALVIECGDVHTDSHDGKGELQGGSDEPTGAILSIEHVVMESHFGEVETALHTESRLCTGSQGNEGTKHQRYQLGPSVYICHLTAERVLKRRIDRSKHRCQFS